MIVAESFAGRLTAFDIDPDGGLSNRRVWAEGVGPDGICLDAEGAVWTQRFTGNACVRVGEGGLVLQAIELDRGPFACTLGGPEGGRCSSWRPSGAASVPWTTRSRVGPVGCSPSEPLRTRAGWP
jgi:sugar lactone lactonase YvrE